MKVSFRVLLFWETTLLNSDTILRTPHYLLIVHILGTEFALLNGSPVDLGIWACGPREGYGSRLGRIGLGVSAWENAGSMGLG